MKTLLNCLAVLTLVSVSSAFAGDCRPGLPTWQPPTCEIRPVCQPVYRPIIVDPCPPQPAVRWPGHCRISVCPPEPSCRISVCPQPTCHRCGHQICQCHSRPACRITVCEPVHQPVSCRLVCHPVTSCRIRPADPVVTNPELPWPHPGEPAMPHPGYAATPEPPVAPAEPEFPGAPVLPGLPDGGEQAPGQLPQVMPGQQVSIEGTRFGSQPGRVAIHVGGMQLVAQVVSWSNGKVEAIIPDLPLSAAADAQVAVLNAQGQLADQLNVMMVPDVTVPQQLARR